MHPCLDACCSAFMLASGSRVAHCEGADLVSTGCGWSIYLAEDLPRSTLPNVILISKEIKMYRIFAESVTMDICMPTSAQLSCWHWSSVKLYCDPAICCHGITTACCKARCSCKERQACCDAFLARGLLACMVWHVHMCAPS